MRSKSQWRKREGIILPCVIDYSALEKAQWFPDFLEFVKMSRGKGAVVAQEEYRKPLQELIDSESPEIRKKQFIPGAVSSEELRAADIRYVPDALLNDLPAEHVSEEQRYAYMLEHEYSPLEQWLFQTFEDIEKQYGAIAALVTFRESKALSGAALQKGIPIFYYDCGTFRPPVYRPTAYLDDHGFFIHAGLQQRYEAFCMQMTKEDESLILSPEEILGLMLEAPYMGKVNIRQEKTTCACGVCMQEEVMNARMSGRMISNEELINDARECFGDDILIRGVPGKELGEHISAMNARIDQEQFAIDFLSKCDTVVCNISNMAYEALLLGKQVYCKTKGLYQFMGIQALKQPLDTIPEDKTFLSYVAFGFYIPRELLYDEDYLRWRATKPTEIEIYKVNLLFILLARGVFDRWLSLSGQERFENLMEQRGFLLNGISKHAWNVATYFMNFEGNDLPSGTMYIKALRSFLVLRERTSESYCQELWAQHMQIQQQNEILVTSQSQNASLSQALQECNETLVTSQNQNASLSQALLECNASLVTSQNQNASLSQALQECNASLFASQNQNASLSQTLLECQTRYETLINTLSWKITAPLRKTKRAIKLFFSRSG